MKHAPVFPKGRDLDTTATILHSWLAARHEVTAVEIDDPAYPQGAGVSNETVFVRLHSGRGIEPVVLRVAPASEYQMFLDPKFRIQHQILVALRQHSDVRVAEPLWLEEDPSVLGRPFYLMRRVTGSVPVSMPVYNLSGFLADATPGQRRTLWEDAMGQLAAIHRVPAGAVDFVDRPEYGASGDQQQLAYWSAHARWTLEDDIPDTVHTLLQWLTDNQPADSVPGLSWGDARIGNIAFGPDFRVSAVMDWEQASLAGPVADLAWWLVFDEARSTGLGVPRLDGLGTRDETIDLWQELTGLRADDLRWHEVFACLKAGLLSLRTRRVLRLPPVDTGTRRYSFLRHACELVGIPEPQEGL
ncbi:phosphotransferase family protein [Nocardia carnea]|uniref:Phosphotransferase family protein n=1 Tax=Nocardia carnea TaxID=37328 RepID=A0ABW7TSJ3_9NOCA|nr:phosphotransferase family protein [Nocardia carnea]